MPTRLHPFQKGTYVYFDYNIVHDDLQTGWCYRRKVSPGALCLLLGFCVCVCV